jgi:cyclase
VKHNIRVLTPAIDVLAFYEGRDGHRFAEQPNWVDDGALSLGIASYAVLAEGEAVVYDTHLSVERGRYIRTSLEALGARRFTVVLSHWHLDHVAGSAAFADCEIIASERTAELLARHRPAIETGTHEGPPPIDPLILPTRRFVDQLSLTVGKTRLKLLHTNIHSDDATVIWLPDQRLLLCGDTMEDTVTYVDEPANFDTHLDCLERLRQLAPERILPNHGDPDVIAAGGYETGLIDATEDYIRALIRCSSESEPRRSSLRNLIAESLSARSVHYFSAYEAVHRSNVQTVLRSGGKRASR